MSKYNRSTIAKNANAIFYSKKNRAEKVKMEKGLDNEFISQSESWSAAYIIEDTKRELRENVLFVRFVRSNGEVTERKATLKVDYINYESKGNTRKQNPLQIKYYEVESNCFKSFNIFRLKGISQAGGFDIQTETKIKNWKAA